MIYWVVFITLKVSALEGDLDDLSDDEDMKVRSIVYSFSYKKLENLMRSQ